jgi:hypothetical protein
MSDEKTPKACGAAPFHLGRRCTEVGAEPGRLHEARHADTGTAARHFCVEAVPTLCTGSG